MTSPSSSEEIPGLREEVEELIPQSQVVPQDLCDEVIDFDDPELNQHEELVPEHQVGIPHQQIAPQDIDLTCEEVIDFDDPELNQHEELVLEQQVGEAAIIRALILQEIRFESIGGVNSQARAVIINAMLGSFRARMYPRAVDLAVQLFDRYFDVGKELDHVTVASLCLYIAVKYEYGLTKAECLAFPHRDFETECLILHDLDYRLHRPTTQTFVETFLFAQPDPTLRFLCAYITELSLLDIELAMLLPSVVATACIFLAQFVLHPDRQPLFPAWVNVDSEAIMILHDLLLSRRYGNFMSTRTKYASLEFGGVATIPCRDQIPWEYLL